MQIKTSYLWWQANGLEWRDEIHNRKRSQVYYHIQELLLLDYFHSSKFKRVLEFGCGFGRHLQYLREIPDLEVFGYDQSDSIVSSIKNWVEHEWFHQHIQIGLPNSKLPYEDKCFDAVFTNSVLIHIPPEDVVDIIKELARIAKYQILHQEPSPDFQVTSSCHDGCWNHNILELYRSIGYNCEILEPAFDIQRIHRVLLDSNTSTTYTPSSIFVRKLFDLELSIQPTINSLLIESENHARVQQDYENLKQKYDRVLIEGENYARVQQDYENLKQKYDGVLIELEEIINSRTWKLIKNIKNIPLVYKLGHQFLDIANRNITQRSPQHLPSVTNFDFSDKALETWLQSFKQQGKEVLAIYVPNWLGIKSATENHFQDCYPFAEHITREQAEYYAYQLITFGVKHLIVAGGSPGHLEIVRAISKLNYNIRCDLTWHASYIQHCEDYGWSMLNEVIKLAKQGVIYKLGLAKKGMEKSFQSLGIKAEFLPNLVQSVPDKASEVNCNNIQLGIWLSWIGYRKLPYAMIAASQLIDNSVLNMSGVGYRAKEWAEILGIKINFFSDGPISKEELYKRIKNTHVSLYLTLSECAPMLPIESLSLGVPCLISPVSHWFEDDDYLHSRLVVPYPERPEVIAKYIQQSLIERNEIIKRYKEYAIRYNKFARQQVKIFLGD